jgi:hypothetical protein
MKEIMEWLIVFLFLYGGGLIAVAIAISYFYLSGVGTGTIRKSLGSVFGIAIALVLISVFLWPEKYHYNPTGRSAFFALQFLPVLGLAVSLLLFTGRKVVHSDLVPLGFIAWAWVFLIGYVIVNGK